MKEKNTKFCIRCGLLLNKKWNKKYNNSHEGFCNSECKRIYEHGKKIKEKKVSNIKNDSGDLFNE